MTEILVDGLRRIDAMQLDKVHPGAEISFPEQDITDSEHGELATAAVVAVTLAGLQVLASWLMKNRKGTHVTKTLEVVDADGSRRTETLEIDLSESKAPDKDVLEALASIAKVDLSQL